MKQNRKIILYIFISVIAIISLILLYNQNNQSIYRKSDVFMNDIPEDTVINKTLHEAVEQQNLVLVEKILIQDKTQINERNENGQTPLMVATVINDISIAKSLIDNGADVNIQDNKLDSPYLYAGAEGKSDILSYIIENGKPNDTIYNRYGGNALIPAAEKGHLENVQILTQFKQVDINHQNNFGYTALIEAVALTDGSEVYQEIVQILVDAGADIQLRDRYGKTAFDYAKDRNYQKIIEILAP